MMSGSASSGGGVRELLGRGSVYTLATAAQAMAGLLVVPVVTRLLDPAEYGVVASAMVVLQLLGLAAALGLPGVIMLEWFDGADGPTRARRLAVTTVLGAVLVAALVDLTGPWWSTLFSGLGYDAPLRLAVWSAVPLAAVGASQGLLRSARRAGTFVAVTLAATLGAQLLALAAMLVVGATPTAYFGGLFVGLSTAGLAGLLLGGVRSPRPADLRVTRRSLGTGMPTVPHSIALFALFAVDRVMVERYDGLAAAGRYQLAYLVGAVGLSLVAAVNNAWSPIILSAQSDARWRALAQTSKALTRLAVPIVAGTALAAPILLGVAAPSSYDTAALSDVTVLVAASLLPYVLYLSNVHVVFFHRRTNVLAVATPVAATANVALNVLLIPAWGLAGAAVASVLGYLLLAGFVALAARRLAAVPWAAADRWWCWLAGAAAVSVALVLPTEGGPWLVLRGLGTVLAGAAVLVVGRAALREERSLEDELRTAAVGGHP